ncbi:RusA family crossover junction endodeoxyribonuclease [Anaerosolibacter sp.]|uniref:RusA family crossover junction endodeoxyribonuclease n=1 Tax=Anaerosolibacter sp. TaxID=1872527 RepID=UPI0039EDFBCF
MILFKIPGEPVAKARPRITGKGIAYTPKKTVNYENLVKEIYMITYGQTMLEGELAIDLKLYFQIPKSASKKKKDDMEAGEIRPTKKPDLDNVLKAITDSLNGIAYGDDSQIVRATVEKYYSQVPRAEVMINQINKGETA